jgi:hypothetical protein
LTGKRTEKDEQKILETYSNMMSFVRSVLHRMKKGKEERKATNWDDEDLLIVIIFFIDSDKHHLAREL